MLEAFPETQVNIDLKDEEVRLVERVGEVITSQGAEGRSVPSHMVRPSPRWLGHLTCRGA